MYFHIYGTFRVARRVESKVQRTFVVLVFVERLDLNYAQKIHDCYFMDKITIKLSNSTAFELKAREERTLSQLLFIYIVTRYLEPRLLINLYLFLFFNYLPESRP